MCSYTLVHANGDRMDHPTLFWSTMTTTLSVEAIIGVCSYLTLVEGVDECVYVQIYSSLPDTMICSGEVIQSYVQSTERGHALSYKGHHLLLTSQLDSAQWLLGVNLIHEVLALPCQWFFFKNSPCS
jgi:hypothetical protein